MFRMSSDTSRYYLRGEHYDWTSAPRGLEKIFHTLRSRIFTERTRNPILDLGCGTGLISRKFTSVLGIDINRWNLLRNSCAGRIQATAEHLPVRTGSFKVVICTEMLEHVDSPEKVLREVLRILVPGGRLYGSVPSDSLLWKLRRFLSVTHPHTEPFHNNYSRKQIQKLLAPFANVRVRYANLGMILAFQADN